jgi:hypothetical protein
MRHLDAIEEGVSVRVDAAQQKITFVINLAKKLGQIPARIVKRLN